MIILQLVEQILDESASHNQPFKKITAKFPDHFLMLHSAWFIRLKNVLHLEICE